MAIGLLILVSTGIENLYFSYNPEITFFKIAYKRHTNFSTEVVPQYFKNIPNFGKRVSVNISKNADLLGQIHLYIKLPNISPQTHSYLPENIKKISWIKKIGYGIIKYVDLEIGGTLIERNYGDWLNIWEELTSSSSKKRGINKMIGNIETLTDYSNGKESYILNIPLNFWFCNSYGISLPLIAITANDIKLHIEFNDFEKCYKETPEYYIQVKNFYCLLKKNELIQQNVDGQISIGKFVYFDTSKKRVYYDKIKGDFLIPETENSKYNIYGKNNNFEIILEQNKIIIKDESYFINYTPNIQNAYLLVNYIYLDNSERLKFLKKDHEYLITTVQNIQEQTIFNVNYSAKLPLINPTVSIYWRCQLNSNFMINDLFNYTTYPLTEKEESLINNEHIEINSQPVTEINSSEYYQLIQTYQAHNNSPSNGINCYSFSMFPEDNQPSGSLNYSKIDDSKLKLTMNKIINYQNTARIRIYSVQYNVFRIIHGLGGLVFSN